MIKTVDNYFITLHIVFRVVYDFKNGPGFNWFSLIYTLPVDYSVYYIYTIYIYYIYYIYILYILYILYIYILYILYIQYIYIVYIYIKYTIKGPKPPKLRLGGTPKPVRESSPKSGQKWSKNGSFEYQKVQKARLYRPLKSHFVGNHRVAFFDCFWPNLTALLVKNDLKKVCKNVQKSGQKVSKIGLFLVFFTCFLTQTQPVQRENLFFDEN